MVMSLIAQVLGLAMLASVKVGWWVALLTKRELPRYTPLLIFAGLALLLHRDAPDAVLAFLSRVFGR